MSLFIASMGIFSCIYAFNHPKEPWAFAGAVVVTLSEFFIYGLTALTDPGVVKETFKGDTES